MKKKKAGKKRRESAKSRKNKAAMCCISFVVTMLLAVLLFEGHSMKMKIHANEERTAKLEKQIEKENKRTDDINSLSDYMQSDEYLEKSAKEKLGLVKENEIIFKESK
jgi:cell division protein DivIC